MVSRRKKSEAVVSILLRKNLLGPMIYTISQRWKIFNQWIDAIGSQHD
jgi:hypothetical protein